MWPPAGQGLQQALSHRDPDVRGCSQVLADLAATLRRCGSEHGLVVVALHSDVPECSFAAFEPANIKFSHFAEVTNHMTTRPSQRFSCSTTVSLVAFPKPYACSSQSLGTWQHLQQDQGPANVDKDLGLGLQVMLPLVL